MTVPKRTHIKPQSLWPCRQGPKYWSPPSMAPSSMAQAGGQTRQAIQPWMTTRCGCRVGRVATVGRVYDRGSLEGALTLREMDRKIGWMLVCRRYSSRQVPVPSSNHRTNICSAKATTQKKRVQSILWTLTVVVVVSTMEVHLVIFLAAVIHSKEENPMVRDKESQTTMLHISIQWQTMEVHRTSTI